MATNEIELVKQVRDLLIARKSELKTHIECLDDTILLKFIRACDYEPKFSAQVVINYFSVRAQHGDIFKCPQEDEEVLKVLKVNLITRCSKTNDAGGGERIFYFRPGRWDHSTISPMNMFASIIVLLEYFTMDEVAQKYGFSQLEVNLHRCQVFSLTGSCIMIRIHLESH